jgi:hypothetical protein
MIATINRTRLINNWKFKQVSTLSPATRLHITLNLHHKVGMTLDDLNEMEDWKLIHYFHQWTLYGTDK